MRKIRAFYHPDEDPLHEARRARLLDILPDPAKHHELMSAVKAALRFGYGREQPMDMIVSAAERVVGVDRYDLYDCRYAAWTALWFLAWYPLNGGVELPIPDVLEYRQIEPTGNEVFGYCFHNEARYLHAAIADWAGKWLVADGMALPAHVPGMQRFLTAVITASGGFPKAPAPSPPSPPPTLYPIEGMEEASLRARVGVLEAELAEARARAELAEAKLRAVAEAVGGGTGEATGFATGEATSTRKRIRDV